MKRTFNIIIPIDLLQKIALSQLAPKESPTSKVPSRKWFPECQHVTSNKCLYHSLVSTNQFKHMFCAKIIS